MSTKRSGQSAMRVVYGESIDVRPSSMPLLKPYPLRQPRPDGSATVVRVPDVPSFRGAFSARETRHNFVIECLPKKGWFKPQAYLYICARCKWGFKVNDPAGAIIPLDQKGNPLPEDSWQQRVETFAAGPCPAFPRSTVAPDSHAERRGWIRAISTFFSSRPRSN